MTRQRISDYVAPPVLLGFFFFLIIGIDEPDLRMIAVLCLVFPAAYTAAMITSKTKPKWWQGWLAGISGTFATFLFLGAGAEAVGEGVGTAMWFALIPSAAIPGFGRLLLGGDSAEELDDG